MLYFLDSSFSVFVCQVMELNRINNLLVLKFDFIKTVAFHVEKNTGNLPFYSKFSITVQDSFISNAYGEQQEYPLQ